MSANNNRNNEPKLNDIRKPKDSHRLNGRWFPKADFSNIHVPRSERGLKIFAVGVAVIVVALLGGLGYMLILRGEATNSTNVLLDSLGGLVRGPFASNYSVNDGQVSASSKYSTNFLDAVPLLKDIPVGFADAQKFADLLMQTQSSLAELRGTGLNMFLSGNGDQLLTQLNAIDSDFKNLASLGDSIRNIADEFNILAPATANDYFSTGSEMQRETDAMDSLIALMAQPNSHILILFENTGIERPGGGRISAYANVTISDGSLAGFTVNDINSLQAYDQKVVPPLQLQTVETSWKLRDLDWFFNFPTSATTTMYRIEAAETAEGRPEQYSGVIAVSPRVIQDFIDVLGPIQLPDGRNVTAVNLGSEETVLGYIPFLNQLMQAMQKRAANLTDDEKGNLLSDASSWMANRDVELYSTDPKIEDLIDEYNAGGQTYQIASGYIGDYLAVVHTDIGNGGEANDSISLSTNIGSSGTIENNLGITRENGGDSLNQEYFQVIVPSGSKLISIIGNTHNTVTPSINYKQSNYIVDPDITSIESTREVDPDSLAETYNMSGNTVFGFWLTLLPGITSTVSVTYDSPQIPLASGEGYQFVMERQPGENANLIYSVQAPQGWQWQQVGGQTYLYSSDDLPGRTILNINLTKNGS